MALFCLALGSCFRRNTEKNGDLGIARPTIALAMVLAAVCPAVAQDRALNGLVDPMVGTGNDDQGDTIPGPTLPAGSIHPSPETISTNTSNAGYDRDAPLSGFAQLHTQGSGGTTSYGTFLVSPQTGVLAMAEADHLSPKSNERAGAAGYSVRLDRYATDVEIAPAHHAALYRFTFPQTGDAHLLFDVTRKIKGALGSDGAEVTLIPREGKIVGRVRSKGYWSPAKVDIWFVAKVDAAPTAWGIESAGVRQDGATTAQVTADRPLRAWWTFGDQGRKPVAMKIAVSFTSAERAEALLDQDVPGWDIAPVRSAAARAWDGVLSKVTIAGVPEADKRRFYTALYHSAIQPRDRTQDQPEADRKTPLYDDHYTLWDTYHTLYPLMSLIRPAEYAGVIGSFIHSWERFGAADTAFIAGRNFHVGQAGDEVDNVIGEGFLRGVPGVDWRKAADVVLFNAHERRRPRYLVDGFFAVGDRSPEGEPQRARSGSATVGMALNDYYASVVAAGAGRTDEAAALRKRSGNWRNVWDASATSDGYSGFVGPRFADGTFQPNDPKRGWNGKKHDNFGFYEGTGWIYSYAPVHDIPAMVAIMGGRDAFVRRLQHAFDAGLIDYTNEPSFSTPWLFSEVGRPDLASLYANRVFTRFTATAYPGDEDNGAMSSYYVFNRIGLFPKLGSAFFYLHAPHQPRSVITLPDGRTFSIVAHGYRPGAIYIGRAMLNGKRLDSALITQDDILKGGTLDLEVTRKPGSWSRSPPVQH
jgi:predicted alpha-1,2-mannosidase